MKDILVAYHCFLFNTKKIVLWYKPIVLRPLRTGKVLAIRLILQFYGLLVNYYPQLGIVLRVYFNLRFLDIFKMVLRLLCPGYSGIEFVDRATDTVLELFSFYLEGSINGKFILIGL